MPIWTMWKREKSQEIGIENAEWIHLIRNEIKKRDFMIICITLVVS